MIWGLVGLLVGGAFVKAVGATGVAKFLIHAFFDLSRRVLVDHFTSTPQAQTVANLPTASPTYSLSARGNRARLNQPIPAIYGRHIVYPDLATTPYYIYKDNDQYLHQLYCIGQGEYDIEQIRIENTPITSFKDIDYKIISPSEDMDFFDANVYSVSEVAGQELETANEWFGPFATNPPKTKTNQIQIDVTFPQGLYYQGDSGLSNVSVGWKIQIRPIDDRGTAGGVWSDLGSEHVNGSNPTALRKTYTYTDTVPKGRYEVRLARTSNKSTSHRTVDTFRWKGLKSKIVEPNVMTYGDVTLLAMKVKATENLSQQSLNKVNCIVTRKLPSYSSQALTPTRSIGLALLDICRQGGLTDSQIDIAALQALDNTWGSRSDGGDHFDGIFDTQTNLWDALNKVAKVGRAVCFVKDGKVRFVRDAEQSDIVDSFSPEDMVKGSFGLQFLPINEKTRNGLVIEYFSSITWKPEEVLVTRSTSGSGEPGRVRLFGCTSEAHARREGEYILASDLYRRCLVRFQTGLEALVLSYGDLIEITHDLWGGGTKKAKVLGLKPRKEGVVAIEAVSENPAVHVN